MFCFTDRLADELPSFVQLLNLRLMFEPLLSLLFQEVGIGVALEFKLGEVTATVSQLDVGLFLNRRIEVAFNLALLNLADITGQYMSRQVSEAVEVANSEGVLDPVHLIVGVFVKHRREVRHFVMVRYD